MKYQWTWLLCQNKASHIYIYKAHTGRISLSSKRPPGTSGWLSGHVTPFGLSQLLLSLSTVNYQIKVRPQKNEQTVISAPIPGRRQILLAAFVFASEMSMPPCQRALSDLLINLFVKGTCPPGGRNTKDIRTSDDRRTWHSQWFKHPPLVHFLVTLVMNK